MGRVTKACFVLFNYQLLKEQFMLEEWIRLFDKSQKAVTVSHCQSNLLIYLELQVRVVIHQTNPAIT